ncbi:extracellular solute-binding protein [Paenibacillus sp. IB182493]|uniref:Extracellular solute-binding protein n=2 Tax=Paenibacillus arenilitoris TaxID=2772299 RepID=A0A927H4E6_9BACL|nr:extracellular solute-binding protein [Paenibacillus arenilitoris]
MKASLTAAIGAAVLVGCSGGSGTTNDTQGAGGESGDKPVEISFFTNGKVNSKVIKSYSDMESFKEIEKRTGTKINFMEAADDKQFNIMLASGTYPDVMYVRGSYPGGIAKLVEDGVVIRLNELIDQHAPNFKKILEENPEVKRQIALDDGTIAKFPELALDLRRNAWSGHLIRQDWLDKVGLPAPVTIDDWYTALKAFKEKDPNGNGAADEIPLGDQTGAGSLNSFTGAFGLLNGFQVHPATGKITFGPYEAAYKDYLTAMRKWYEEGLIDPEFAAIDKKAFEAKFSNNTIGAYGGTITGINTYKELLASTVPDFNLIGVSPPVGPAGKPYSQSTRLVQNVPLDGVVVSSQAKDPVAAVKLLDFMIGPEGSLLQNWGIEGKSYTVVDGKKKFTDEIMNNPDGLLPWEAVYKYAHPTNGMAQNFDFDAWAAFELKQPAQKVANELWFNADSTLLLPPLLFKGDESQQISSIMSEVDTYVQEMRLKFVMGNEPIEQFGKYTETLNKMNIEEAIKIYQAAYDRYQAK